MSRQHWPHDPPTPPWHLPPDPTGANEVDWRDPPQRNADGLSARDIMTVAEAAELLRCSKRHVYNLVHHDELPGARYLGRSIVVVRPVLISWLLDNGDQR